MAVSQPLVSIGIPTYNRADKLSRAVHSALSQTYQSLEVVITDNASTDDTATLCATLQREDSRIRYIRQASNIGPAANFLAARDNSRGEYFMWLGDDDWIDRDYIEKCLEALRDPDCAVAGGLAIYVFPDNRQIVGSAVDVRGDTPQDRIVDYYARVTDNALFYGVYRRKALDAIPLKNVLAADWLFIAAVLLSGSGRTIVGTRVWREIGASASFRDTLRVIGAPAWHRFVPYGIIAALVFSDIAVDSPKFAEVFPWRPRRLALAARAAARVARRYGLGTPRVRPWVGRRARHLFRRPSD